jgi:ABC-type Mn2+/Zn2+ transport system permease subunit
MLDFIGPPFLQRATVELLLLAVLAGALGPWIVLRRLAFFSHAAGTGAFPGLVLASAWGIPAPLGALAGALGLAAGVDRAQRTRRLDAGAATGLLLVAALAVGAVLASDVFESGTAVDRLLFGTLIGLTQGDVALTGAAAALAVLVALAFGRRWLAEGFEERPTGPLLLVVIVVAVVVAVDAVGALLVSAILVVPAATVRLLTEDRRALHFGTAALAGLLGLGGLAIAYAANVGPGPAVAVLGTLAFAAARARSA